MTTRIIRHILPVFLVLPLILASDPGHAQQAGLSASKQERVRSALARYMTDQKIRGLSFAIGRNDAVLYADGLGEAREGVEATRDTVYPIGTISQQFTAGLILYLQRYGTGPGRPPLTIQDPLTEYFFGISHWQETHLGHLLTHTSGIPSFTDSVFYRERVFSDVERRRVLNFIKARELKFQPGKDFEYSDSNYFLLANVVEIALEVFFYDHMRTEIFEQLELTNTSFLHLTPLGRRAQGFRETGQVPEVNYRLLMGSGDITSTAPDLVRWNNAVLRTDYLGEVARRVMFGQFVWLENIKAYYGAGWFVRPGEREEQYFTIGFFPGFSSINKVYRDKRSGDDIYIVILTNRDDAAGIEPMADRLYGILR